jgi:hypothetical protein
MTKYRQRLTTFTFYDFTQKSVKRAQGVGANFGRVGAIRRAWGANMLKYALDDGNDYGYDGDNDDGNDYGYDGDNDDGNDYGYDGDNDGNDYGYDGDNDDGNDYGSDGDSDNHDGYDDNNDGNDNGI